MSMAFISGNPDVFFAPGEIDGVEIYRTGTELAEATLSATDQSALDSSTVRQLNAAENAVIDNTRRIAALKLQGHMDPAEQAAINQMYKAVERGSKLLGLYE